MDLYRGTRKLEIVEYGDRLVIKNIDAFQPKHIFECGQAFRWYVEEDGSYTTIHKGRVVNVGKGAEEVILQGTDREDFEKIWYDYFDLGLDYGEIKKKLSQDPVLQEAIGFGQGVRILNQEPFETTISFIISANNQIPRIKKSIELISKEYGELIMSYKGRDHFSFPRPEALAQVDPEELEAISRVGYRAKYIVESSRMIAQEEVKLEDLFNLARQEAQEILMKLPGVGPKVSDCILLFALKHKSAFPVDVWVKRVMEHFYFKEDTSRKKISQFANERFGNLGGFAQQYLFYYAREKGIGKKKKK